MDRLEAMRIFVRVVERGSFSAVANELGSSQPNISKQIRALEQALGGSLLARSTRSLSLTDEGQRYYADCRQILASVDAAERSFQSGREAVAGTLRIASSVSFGRAQIAVCLPAFLKRHPQVRVELQLSDRNEDLLGEGVDVAVRIGELRDSNLVGRSLGTLSRALLASPAYLQLHGEPETPEALQQHNCLVFSQLADHHRWRLRSGERQVSVSVSGNVSSNSSEAIRELVLAGQGISLSPLWAFRADMEAGRVRMILPAWRPEALPIHVLYPPNRRQSARVLAFVEFLGEHLQQGAVLDQGR